MKGGDYMTGTIQGAFINARTSEYQGKNYCFIVINDDDGYMDSERLFSFMCDYDSATKFSLTDPIKQKAYIGKIMTFSGNWHNSYNTETKERKRVFRAKSISIS